MLELIFIPNLMSLLNLVFGFIAIIHPNIYICHVFSLFFDFIDGKLARFLKVESLIGEQLDSLADMVSFVVVPSVLGYNKYNLIIPNIIYLMCGCYRLAKFNVKHSPNFFEGLPTPLSCSILLIGSYFISNTYVISFIYLLLSYLMISKIKITKM